MDKDTNREVLKRIKAIVKDYGAVRPGRWIYIDRSDIKPRDKLDTDQLFVDGYNHNINRVKTGEVIKQAEDALGKLDKIRQDTFLELGELDKGLLDSYWDVVEQIESDIANMLCLLGFQKFDSGEVSIRHILRAIKRFDFRTMPVVYVHWSIKKNDFFCNELDEALSAAEKIETPEIGASILRLAGRAADSDSLDDYESEVVSLCIAIIVKDLKRARPKLRKISKSEDSIIAVSSCRAILELEGIYPEDSKHTYAKKARRIVAERKKATEWLNYAAMMEDEDWSARRRMIQEWAEEADYDLRLSNALYCPMDINMY